MLPRFTFYETMPIEINNPGCCVASLNYYISTIGLCHSTYNIYYISGNPFLPRYIRHIFHIGQCQSTSMTHITYGAMPFCPCTASVSLTVQYYLLLIFPVHISIDTFASACGFCYGVYRVACPDCWCLLHI